MSSRALVALGVFLLVVGVALPIASVTMKGVPWGFRGHRGVLVESAGDAQVTDADGTKRASATGTWIEVGDEVRAGRYSLVRLRLPEGSVSLMDSGVLRVTQKGVLLSSGALDIGVPAGASRMSLEMEGIDGALLVRPGSGDAQVRVLADGKGAVFAHVRAGSVEVGGINVETGQVVTLGRGQAPKAAVAPTALTLNATCDGDAAVVTTSPATQVFTPGAARVSDGAPLRIDVAPGSTRVIVSARDVSGNIAAPREIPCVRAAPPAPKRGKP